MFFFLYIRNDVPSLILLFAEQTPHGKGAEIGGQTYALQVDDLRVGLGKTLV